MFSFVFLCVLSDRLKTTSRKVHHRDTERTRVPAQSAGKVFLFGHEDFLCVLCDFVVKKQKFVYGCSLSVEFISFFPDYVFTLGSSTSSTMAKPLPWSFLRSSKACFHASRSKVCAVLAFLSRSSNEGTGLSSGPS